MSKVIEKDTQAGKLRHADRHLRHLNELPK